MSISNLPSPVTLTDSKSKITGAFSSVIPAISLISFSITSFSCSGISIGSSLIFANCSSLI